MHNRSLLTASLLAAATNAWGQVTPPAQNPPDLSPVVVTATRIPTPIDQVGSSITLITAADIEASQRRTLPDLLDDAPGLGVFQTGGPGGLTSVFIRGANANHTKVIIDGIEVNDPSQNGAFDFGQVLTSGLDRVEILRGPQSSLYGADALGGVISITSHEGEGPARLNASLEGGAFQTFDQAVGVSGASAPLRYALDLSHFRSGDTPVTPLDLLAPGERRIGDRYDNVTAAGRLRLDLGQEASLAVTVRYVDAVYRSTGETYGPTPALDFPDAAQTDQWTRQLFARLEGRFSLAGDRLSNIVGAGYTKDHTTIQSPDDGFGLPPPVVDDGDRLKFDWQGTLTLDARDTVVAGVDETTDRLIDSPIDARESRIGGFAELQSRPVSAFDLAASVRYDADDRFGDKATWRVAPVYTIAATGTLLRASYGTGYKTPTLTQLFVSYPSLNFSAKPNLKPEESQGYDVGVEQPLVGNHLRLGATWFHNSISDLIETNLAGDSWANIGRATTYGVESFVAARLTPRLSLRGDYTWTIARDDIAQRELLRRPKVKASLGGAWRPTERLSLSARLLYVGAWFDGNRDFSNPYKAASPYATLDVAANYRLGHGLTAFARVDNLLDRHYEDPIGFDKPGIGAFAGIRFGGPL